jgi:CheY-like chemotaxis protein
MSARRHRYSTDEPASFHVFHVDDSPDDHMLLKAAAEMAEVPFTWDVAESADTAIFYLQTLVALEGKSSLRWPDLILLDVSLPQGGGFKVLEFIRASPASSSLQVVVLSGNDAPAILEKAYELGADAVLIKPGAFRDLVKLATSLHATWGTAGKLSAGVSPTVEALHLMALPAR